MGIRNRTKEDIHILEIFPRTLIDETSLLQPSKGIWGKNRYLEMWKLEKGVVFIKRVFLIVQMRGQRKEIVSETENLSVLGLRRRGNSINREIGARTKKKLNKRGSFRAGQMVQSNIYNSKIFVEMEENSRCEFNKQGNIDDSFKKNGTDQVRDLKRNGDCATSQDLKSAFHRLLVYPPHRSFLVFEAMGKVYQYRAMPLGTQHSPIFFTQAIAMVLTKIRRESDIRILNYVDDLLVLLQNKERLREQIQTIMGILEAFGWTIAQEKCETEQKQQTYFS
ncbi:MAG: hypothetical protein EZS28_008622 [Streblomastix strix]|uniref:Reverse transcriptase domain-containing protein n=1 Tax=Streblomastix strix TaxID=222440 RepID=A0A5J4WLU7_9EUKA|nr:MAG: hypothetical protein EZS28_008622 [Streblomastix strix]